MNRISLYEAIRRKKDAESLNTASQGQPVPKQAPRAEIKSPLKQPAKPAAPAMPEKQPTKSAIKLTLPRKTSSIGQPPKKAGYQKALDGVGQFIKANPRLAGRIGIAAGIVVVAVLLYSAISSRKTDDVSPTQPLPPIAKKADSKPVENKPVHRTPPAVAVSTPQEKQPIFPPVQKPQGEETKSALPPATQNRIEPKPAEETTPAKPQEEVKPAKPAGDHIIVIVAYTRQEDLAPVSAYFGKNGVETEVVKQGSYYLLVTKDRFENPERSGTDGYKMKQTIKRVGANYKAPDGFEKFSSTPFQDAYGKKVK